MLKTYAAASSIREGIEATISKVHRRVENLRKNNPFPILFGQSIILVDDGLASGFTMLVAVEALKKAGTEYIIVAVPTAHKESLNVIISKVDAVICPNIRSGWRYAVADAYVSWSDVDESEVMKILKRLCENWVLLSRDHTDSFFTTRPRQSPDIFFLF
jgi:predicted phosphoribosyltransferase